MEGDTHMRLLKGIGNAAGELTGLVLGGTVRVVGELTGSNFVKEIGDGVEKTSRFAGRTVGDLASGTWDTAAGLLAREQARRKEGMQDLGAADNATVKGTGQVLTGMAENAGNVAKGIAGKDKELLKHGVKGLVYTAAVGAIAVGVVDVLDGPDGPV